MTMTFASWLRQFEEEDNGIGDLAREVAADVDWPDAQDLPTLVGYLEDLGACDDAVEALRKAHRRWLDVS